MELTWQVFAIVCPCVLLAGFIDSVAGGGGLISLPAYLAAGLPAQWAAGTNKFSAGCGTLLAGLRYLRHKRMDVPAALLSAALALPASFLGARIAMSVSEYALRIVMLCSLPPVGIAVLTRKKKEGEKTLSRPRLYGICGALGAVIGLYDGLIGPGTGTLLIMGYTLLAGFDMTTASGNAKVVNLASNIAALTAFWTRGYVLLPLAVPAAACGIAGNWLGSGMAIRKGARFIRPMLIIVLVLIFIKIAYDLLA